MTNVHSLGISLLHVPCTLCCADVWSAWLSDEVRQVDTNDQQLAVIELYRRALEDYIHMDLYVQYHTYATDYHLQQYNQVTYGSNLARFEDNTHLTMLRSLYDTAVNTVGADYHKGYEVWEQVLSFEKERLTEMMQIRREEAAEKEADEDDSDSDSDDEVESSIPDSCIIAQMERIRSLMERSVTFPSVDLDHMYKNYAEWQAKQGIAVDQSVQEAYEKAKKDGREIVKMEEAVLNAEQPSTHLYVAFLPSLIVVISAFA